jgi:hypothetical protein
MNRELLEQQLEKLKVKIPYDEDIFESEENWVIVLTDLLTDSAYILLETLYPFDDFETYQIPTKYYNWQLRCCVELYNLADKQGITNYAENTISWTKLSDGLSNSLMNKINSYVGIPKERLDSSSPLPKGTYNLVYKDETSDGGE